MWINWNNNPTARRVGDCAVRAVSKAIGVDWEEAYDILAHAGRAMGDMPGSKTVVSAVLRQNGFYKKAIPNTCPDCYTAEDFCEEYPRGIYVLAFDDHIATVQDGTIYDSWDSSEEVPLFFWYRKEGR